MRGVGIQNRRKKSGHICALAGKICRQTARTLLMGVLIFTGLFICSPVLLLLSGSMTGEYELTQAFKAVLSGGSGFINWTVLPEFPTLEWYRRLLFYSPQFFILFWNSIKMVLIILAAVGFLWLQEYIVYDRDGSFHLELPWKTETPPAEEEVPPEDVEITIQEPEKPKALAAFSASAAPLTQAGWKDAWLGASVMSAPAITLLPSR